MNYATIKTHDIANGPGVRVSLFVSGCRHHCRGCFNPETWDFNHGTPFTDDTIEEILRACAPDYIQGLTLLGGEPFEPENTKSLLTLVTEFKKRFPQKDLWCYTGYQFEDILQGILTTWHDTRTMNQEQKETAKKLLQFLDVLVDGEFHIEEKDLKLAFRGSTNQRLLDIPSSLLAKKAMSAL